jgi:hypothetical protein
LLAGDAIRLVAQLAQILDQRLERSRIVNGDQTSGTGIEGGLFAGIVRRGAARRTISRPPALLTPSH